MNMHKMVWAGLAKADPQTGIRSEASGAGATVGLNIENSIISGPTYSAVRVASAGYSAIGMHHIAYTPGSSFADVNTGAGTGALQQDVDTAIDPGFLVHRNLQAHSDLLPGLYRQACNVSHERGALLGAMKFAQQEHPPRLEQVAEPLHGVADERRPRLGRRHGWHGARAAEKRHEYRKKQQRFFHF